MRQNAHRARQRRAPRGSPAAVETLTAVGQARVCAQICAHQKLRTKTEKAAPLQASRRRPSHPGSENCWCPRIRQHLVRVRGEKGQEKQSEVTAAERGPRPGLPVSAGALPWPLGSGGAGQGTGLADRDRTRPSLCRGALSKSRPRSGLLSSSLLMGLGQSPPGPGQVDALRGPEPAFKRWRLSVPGWRGQAAGLPSFLSRSPRQLRPCPNSASAQQNQSLP